MPERQWLAAAAFIATIAADGATAQVQLDTLSLRASTFFLAHDLLQGRATGTTGADIAAAYIASECRALGLMPIGDSYVHPVPLEESTVEPGTQLVVRRANQEARFSFPTDLTPDVGTRSTLVDFAGPAVFVGPVSELHLELLRELDLRGAVAVTAGARVSAEAAQTLRQLGAVGIVHLLGDESGYALYRRSRGATRLYHADSAVRSSFAPVIPSVLAGPRLSYAVVSGTALERGEPLAPGPLGRELEFRIELNTRAVDAANVVCLLPGKDALVSDTVIAFAAHYDHLGVGLPDSSGDAIYNGFSDNAAGVAMLLAIAQAMVQDSHSQLRHSLLFLFPVGEERGLLGSDYYVSKPVWPLERTRAILNIDAGAPPGLLVSWRLAGVDSSGLGGLAVSAAASRGWTATTSPARANSDYFPFVREGVPGVLVIPGAEPYEGLTADSSAALRKRWDLYHRPGDHWTEDFPFAGLARYAEYAYLIGAAVDTSSAPIPRPPRR
ncbi:MAG: M28 family peptidase [Gemmatimonadota bacterium]|nr:MAG: M28 family peptidase [Gemmatimonadota bacterium]